MMSAESAVRPRALDDAGIDAFVDGGWGIDALLGSQRRPHGDLDVVVPFDAFPAAVDALRPLGFMPVVDTLPIGLVLSAPGDRRVDVHPTIEDEAGDRIQAQRFGRRFAYPKTSLVGEGVIGGRAREVPDRRGTGAHPPRLRARRRRS